MAQNGEAVRFRIRDPNRTEHGPDQRGPQRAVQVHRETGHGSPAERTVERVEDFATPDGSRAITGHRFVPRMTITNAKLAKFCWKGMFLPAVTNTCRPLAPSSLSSWPFLSVPSYAAGWSQPGIQEGDG
jgi:hypothetical protein